MHQALMTMLQAAGLDMAKTVGPNDIAVFLTNAACTICSTYHTILKASPGAAIFGHVMHINIPFHVDWNKIGEHRQC